MRKDNPLAVKVVPLLTSLFNLRGTWMPRTDVSRDMNKNFVPKENVLTKTTLQFKSVVLLEVWGNQRCRELIQVYLQKKKIDLCSVQTVFLYIYLHYGRIGVTDVSQIGCLKNEDKKRKLTVFVVRRHLQGEALSSVDEILRYYRCLRPEIIGWVQEPCNIENYERLVWTKTSLQHQHCPVDCWNRLVKKCI